MENNELKELNDYRREEFDNRITKKNKIFSENTSKLNKNDNIIIFIIYENI